MMKKPMTYEMALSKTAALCSRSEHCIHELREKMTKWNVDAKDIDRVVDYLVDEKYVDETRFCRAYAHDKLRYNGWGKKKISLMLRMLRVSKSDISTAIDELDEREYRSILADLLASKARSVKAETEYERNGKLIRFALGRGFEMGLICEVLNADEMEEDENEMEEDV